MSFSTKALGEGYLAVAVGGLSGVRVLDAVEVVVDGDGLAGGDGCPLVSSGVPPVQLGGEGDFLIHGWGGGGRSEGDADWGFDADVDDAARRLLVRCVTGEGGIVSALSGGAPSGFLRMKSEGVSSSFSLRTRRLRVRQERA